MSSVGGSERVDYGVADSLVGAGRVVAPLAAGVIATIPQPYPAGKYIIRVAAVAGLMAAAADGGNMQLAIGGTVIMAALPFAHEPSPQLEFVRALAGNGDIVVSAVNAGNAGIVYVATIIATRVE